MDTVTAIKSVLMGIAAQGAVTVTIPEDSDIARDLGPIEMTRQVGPIEFRIETGPAGKTISAAPARTTGRAAPAQATNQPAPAQVKNRPAPEQAAGQVAPAEVENRAAPAPQKAPEAAPEKSAPRAAPEKEAIAAAPQEPARQVAPARVMSQAVPEKVAPRAASPEAESQAAPAEAAKRTAPARTTGYAGLWYDHSGRSAIEISKCDDSLCGRIVWLKNSAHDSACGTPIIGGVKKIGDVYDNGWIYDLERGQKFNVELKLLSESELRVKGYAGMKWLSKTFVWHRAPGDLERCA